MSKQKVALGLSGGVDSAVAGLLLIQAGYEVHGVFMECWNEPGCRTDQDHQDALAVALFLKIPFQVLDFKSEYKSRVFDYFRTEYGAGRTPNPDIVCNREIKFGLFYNWAMAQGYEFIATGHYAAITKVIGKIDELRIKIPQDKHKDQTYFLCQIKPEQLRHILFPLANLTKPEVRQIALTEKMPVANKPESMGVCFIGEFDLKSWLKDEFGENPGQVIDSVGEVIGSHQGLWFTTVGQRSGFSVNPKAVAKSFGLNATQLPPIYALSKNISTNQLVVGLKQDLLSSTIKIENLSCDLSAQSQLFLRIRHGGELYPIISVLQTGSNATITLGQLILVPATGQWGVIYEFRNDDYLLHASGIFTQQFI